MCVFDKEANNLCEIRMTGARGANEHYYVGTPCEFLYHIMLAGQ